MDREKLLDKLRKIKAIADHSPVNGERVIATVKLRLLLTKYGLNESDLSEQKGSSRIEGCPVDIKSKTSNDLL